MNKARKPPETREFAKLPENVKKFVADNVSESTLSAAIHYGTWVRFGRGGWKCYAGWGAELEIIYRLLPESVQVLWYDIE